MGLFSVFIGVLPICKKKIVFSNFNGNGWGGNPKYIAEEILRQRLNYDLVWIVSNRKDHSFPKGIRTVEFNSRRAKYELSTAHVIINNVKNGLPFQKKSSQFYIQTWHGDFALKFIEKEVEDKLSTQYVEASKKDSLITDLVLSGSKQFSDIVKASFWYSGEILESGLPCNDLYFQKADDIVNVFRSEMRIPSASSIALYAPTFRDEGATLSFPDFSRIVDSLERVTEKKWCLVIRLHPNESHRYSEICFSERILNGTLYPDTQEIARVADLLITDYSSIMYDFALQEKPVVLYAPDVDNYQKIRGLRNIFWELPFPMAQKQDDLPKALTIVFDASYKTVLKSFLRERICSYDDGHASKRIVSRIKQVINGDFRG